MGGNDRALLAAIDGVADRNAAELLKGTKLYAPAADVPVSTQDRLIGLEARLEDGSIYGCITAVANYGAGDIIEIKLAGGKSEMLPLNKNFVMNIAIDKGFITVVPPEYVEGKK